MSRYKTLNVSPPASSPRRVTRYRTDSSPLGFKSQVEHTQTKDFHVCWFSTGRKKSQQQQTMPDFLPQPDQHVRLPVQIPRRSCFKMSSSAHARCRRSIREPVNFSGARGGNMLLCTALHIHLQALFITVCQSHLLALWLQFIIITMTATTTMMIIFIIAGDVVCYCAYFILHYLIIYYLLHFFTVLLLFSFPVLTVVYCCVLRMWRSFVWFLAAVQKDFPLGIDKVLIWLIWQTDLGCLLSSLH